MPCCAGRRPRGRCAAGRSGDPRAGARCAGRARVEAADRVRRGRRGVRSRGRNRDDRNGDPRGAAPVSALHRLSRAAGRRRITRPSHSAPSIDAAGLECVVRDVVRRARAKSDPERFTPRALRRVDRARTGSSREIAAPDVAYVVRDVRRRARDIRPCGWGSTVISGVRSPCSQPRWRASPSWLFYATLLGGQEPHRQHGDRFLA